MSQIGRLLHYPAQMAMPPSLPDEPEPLGPVERELVRLLRLLDLSELQPGVRERCWEEFRVLADLPESAPPQPAPSAEAPPPSVAADDPGSIDRRSGRKAPAGVPPKSRLRARPA